MRIGSFYHQGRLNSGRFSSGGPARLPGTPGGAVVRIGALLAAVAKELASPVNTAPPGGIYSLVIHSNQGDSKMQSDSILVIGATGKTGTRVANKLEAKGHSVRRGSRNAGTPFDWEAPETWGPALAGARAAYVTYFPDLAFPGAVEKLGSLVETAKESGVEHVVLLSGRGEHHARLGEDVLRRSGMDFTIVRSAWFAQNFSEGYLRDPILAGTLPMPGGDVCEPIIDIDDIADVVVAALTEEGHKGELYEVTGPRLLTLAEMAHELSVAIGKPIQHIPISFEAFHAGIARSGGDFVANVFTAIARETLDGRNAHLSDGVVRALGRQPRDFTAFARNAAKSGAWSVAA